MELSRVKSPLVTRSVFRVRHPINQDGVRPTDVAILKDIAEKPIVTRGVLLDWYAYAQRKGLPHHPFTNQAIPLDELHQVVREQRVTFRQGDVLVIRTGWTAAYSQLTDAEKECLGGRDDRASCGVEATEAAIRWHWEQGFSAVASDTVAYEQWPSPKHWGVCMHEVGDKHFLANHKTRELTNMRRFS